eukprot:27100_1
MVSKKRILQQGTQYGFDSWYAYYNKLFGSRWEDTLYPSLLKKNKTVGFINPFFKRFPINPQLFHPRAQLCTDPELHGCIYIPKTQHAIQNENKENKFNHLLHPQQLRIARDVDAWMREDEFLAADKQWYNTQPNSASTYYEYFEKLPEYSTTLKHLELYKLSWKDLDPYYVLDPASVRIARLLNPCNGSVFLDMCASPGGKSLIILDNIIKNHNSELQCKLVINEMSFKRTKLLKETIELFIPSDIQKEHCVLTNIDAKLWGLVEQNKYDGILLDVPCSSDRHLLTQKKEIVKWSIKSCKNLNKTQYGLLRSALDAVKVGGCVVYSTCTMNPIENDQLIQQILKKKENKVEIMNIELSVGEKTKYGMQILPDKSSFYEGPLYVCVLRRVY